MFFWAASSGSPAAQESHLSPLSAVGVSAERCAGPIRFSLGRETRWCELDQVAIPVVNAVGI